MFTQEEKDSFTSDEIWELRSQMASEDHEDAHWFLYEATDEQILQKV